MYTNFFVDQRVHNIDDNSLAVIDNQCWSWYEAIYCYEVSVGYRINYHRNAAVVLKEMFVVYTTAIRILLVTIVRHVRLGKMSDVQSSVQS